jgi:hypothetical protein
MATEKQMEFFKLLYDSESERTEFLRATAKTYLTLSAFYSAFVIFVAEKLRPVYLSSKLLFGGAVLSMITSFLLSLWVIQVARFVALTHPQLIFDQYGARPPSDSEFFDNRITDFSVAYIANSKVNDRKAMVLAVGGWALLAGLLLHALFFLDWLCDAGGFNALKS